MPLIVISGLPCSRKTTVAEYLKSYFEKVKNMKAILVTEENFYRSEDRNSIYSDSNKEKKFRASMKSEVERYLSTEDLIIFDSSNYVKGYRYELYCVSRSNSTTQCTVYCSISLEDARKINNEKNESSKYQDSVLEGLFMRYEIPDGKNRWDAPLFHVPFEPSKEHSSKKESSEENNETKAILSEEILEEIHGCLMLRKNPKPHLSTVVAPNLPVDFVHEVDNITKNIVQEIMQRQQYCVPGESITIENSTFPVEFSKPFSMAELQRTRRQFVAYVKSHPISNPSNISSSFVQFVNSRADL